MNEHEMAIKATKRIFLFLGIKWVILYSITKAAQRMVARELDRAKS